MWVGVVDDPEGSAVGGGATGGQVVKHLETVRLPGLLSGGTLCSHLNRMILIELVDPFLDRGDQRRQHLFNRC